TTPEIQRGDGNDVRIPAMIPDPLIVAKEESSVLLDRASNSKSKLIVNGGCFPAGKIWASSQRAHTVELEDAAVYLVRARAQRDVGHSSPGTSQLSFIVARRDVNRRQSFDRRNKHR